jgi:hypothetical protein
VQSGEPSTGPERKPIVQTPQAHDDAPYQPGDRVRALLMARDGGTCLAVVTIDRVTPPLNG